MASLQQAAQKIMDYRQMVITNDKKDAQKILQNTNKVKQDCHSMFMKSSFVAQTRGDFCGLASVASTLHYLNQLIGMQSTNLNDLKNQQFIYNNYVKSCLDVRYGISMLQLIQIVSTIISDYNLPYHISYVCCSDYDKLSRIFKKDINFIDKLFDENNNEEEKKENEDNDANDDKTTWNGAPFMIIGNYWRKIDKHRGGHWSPIINISMDKKWIFIADVSSHRIAPHWIRIDDFIPLMFHRVKSTNLPRGYIRIFHKKYKANDDIDPFERLIINKEKNIYMRLATNLDALTLSKIQVAAWKQTYRGLIDDTWLDSKSMTVVRKYGYWMEIFNNNYLISMNQTPTNKYAVYKYVMVICLDNSILGYCTVGPTGRSAIKKTLPLLKSYIKNLQNIDGELYTLYLSQNCPRRQGIGGSLFDVGYDLIRNRFNWNKTVEIRNNGNDINNDKEKKKKKESVMVLWLLGDNDIAMNFYKKKGGIMINDLKQGAHFGGKKYRYCSMVFGLTTT